MIPIMLLSKAPNIVREFLATFFHIVLNDSTAASIIRSLGKGKPDKSMLQSIFNIPSRIYKYCTGTIEKEYDLSIKIQDFKIEFANLMNEHEIDLIICPVHALPPSLSTSFPFIFAASSYSMAFSLLDYPTGFVPCMATVEGDDFIEDTVGYVHARDDELKDELMEYTVESIDEEVRMPECPPQYVANTGSIKGRFNFLGLLGIEEFNVGVDTLAGTRVGVMVVGRRYEEERVLGLMQILNCL